MRFTTPFGFDTPWTEVLDGVDLTGKRAVVTGGASGLGAETTRALASVGASVVIAARDVAAGEATAAGIEGDVTVRPLELVDPESVAAFVEGWGGPLDILVGNAGVMAPPLTRTPRSWELQFATNHLGHFQLATGLLPALAAAEGARVVSLSSRGHLRSPVVFDDIMFDRREYEPWLGYGQSKTANVLFAVEAARRWADAGVTVNAVHPGGILTPLMRHMTEADQEGIQGRLDRGELKLKTLQQGVSTSVLAAASPLVDGVTGRYFEDCNEALPAGDPPARESGVAAYALDPAAAEQLWTVSEQLLGL